MKEFKARQELADLKKFKEMEKEHVGGPLGEDVNEDDGVAEETKSKTQKAIEERRNRMRLQRDLLIKQKNQERQD